MSILEAVTVTEGDEAETTSEEGTEQTGSTISSSAAYSTDGNRMVSATDALGNVSTYSYTAQNKYLLALDYGNGDRVEYDYDDYGRVTTQTYEDGDTVSYQYDNDGALASVTDSASGITTRYYYDLSGRAAGYSESGENFSHSVGYTYNNKR